MKFNDRSIVLVDLYDKQVHVEPLLRTNSISCSCCEYCQSIGIAAVQACIATGDSCGIKYYRHLFHFICYSSIISLWWCLLHTDTAILHVVKLLIRNIPKWYGQSLILVWYY